MKTLPYMRTCIVIFVCAVGGYTYLRSQIISDKDRNFIYFRLLKNQAEMKAYIDTALFKYHKELGKTINSSLSKQHGLMNHTFHSSVTRNTERSNASTLLPIAEAKQKNIESTKHPFYIHTDTGCRMNGPGQNHSQGMEDILLFKRYFSTPLRCNGTFVELGALDGVQFSNTLFFEENLEWNGVLIEAQPDNAKELMINRKHTTNYALGICEAGVDTVEIIGKGAGSGMKEEMMNDHLERLIVKHNQSYTVPCAPLGTLLHKSGISQVDFFSLDVEGAELLVLKTMDWDIPVLIWLIEMGHGDDDDIQDLMWQHGYRPGLWNIRDECTKRHCPLNMVFENMFWSRIN